MNQSISWLRELKLRLKEKKIVVDGLATFRKISNETTILAIDKDGEWVTVQLSEDLHGYLRLVGKPTFTSFEAIDACSNYQQKNYTVALVLSIYRDYDIEAISKVVKSTIINLTGISEVSFLDESFDKQGILNEEQMKDNDYSLFKITFRVTEFVSDLNCEEDEICLNPLNYCD
jgi:hypothetical protein